MKNGVNKIAQASKWQHEDLKLGSLHPRSEYYQHGYKKCEYPVAFCYSSLQSEQLCLPGVECNSGGVVDSTGIGWHCTVTDPGSGAHGNRWHGNVLTTLGEGACPGYHQAAVAIGNDRRDSTAGETDLLSAGARMPAVRNHGNRAGRVDGNAVRGVHLRVTL